MRSSTPRRRRLIRRQWTEVLLFVPDRACFRRAPGKAFSISGVIRPTESMSSRWTLSLSRKLVSFMRTRSATGASRMPSWVTVGVLKIGNRLQVFWTHLLVNENQMNSAASLGFICVDKHVHARYMAIPKTERLHSFRDALKVLAVNRDIDISSKPSGVVAALANLEKNSQPPNDAILDPRFRQRRMKASQNIE